MLRIATLNICHGGGQRIPRIVEAIASLSPDTVVVTEYRNNVAGENLRSALKAGGWGHQVVTPTPERVNGILVAGRDRVLLRSAPVSETAWAHDRHLVIQTESCVVVAVYLPPGPTKIPSWERLLITAQALVTEPVVLIGDFNTGKHYLDEEGATFIAPGYLDRLEAVGYRDSWRALNTNVREYTWFSPAGNGFRLDYAFLSPVLAPVLSHAQHVDATRIAGVTDHSALVVDLQAHVARPVDAAESLERVAPAFSAGDLSR